MIVLLLITALFIFVLIHTIVNTKDKYDYICNKCDTQMICLDKRDNDVIFTCPNCGNIQKVDEKLLDLIKL